MTKEKRAVSIFGPKFEEWSNLHGTVYLKLSRTNEKWNVDLFFDKLFAGGVTENIPIVWVKVKVNKIWNFNVTEMTVEVDYILVLDWIDPSIGILTYEEEKEKIFKYRSIL